MICQFIVRIAPVGTEHARHAGVASVGAIGMSFDAMREASGNVPSGGEGDRRRRAGSDARASAASRTWVESDRIARMIDFAIKQQGSSKGYPGPEHWMNNNPDDTRAGEPGQR